MEPSALPSLPLQLHISGPALSRYELGEPMFIYDGDSLLGTVEPVEVSPDSSQARIGRFMPSASPRRVARNFGPHLLVEVTMFLVEHFPTIQNVHVALPRNMEKQGDGLMVAAARVEFLRSIGATDVVARPKPDSNSPGNFVVQGVWAYTEDNITSLRLTLARERELCRKHLVCVAKERRLGPLLNRLKDWWARRDVSSPYPS